MRSIHAAAARLAPLLLLKVCMSTVPHDGTIENCPACICTSALILPAAIGAAGAADERKAILEYVVLAGSA